VQFGKIAGICLIIVGFALLGLQAEWSMSVPAPPVHGGARVEREWKSSPYPGIFGMALVVGGAGFVFAARRRKESHLAK
jgi:hypothetical protein